MTPQDFAEWLDGAKVGDHLIYHTGSGMFDFAATEYRSKVFEAAWRAGERGLVFLSQKRLGNSHFEFSAERMSWRTHERIEKINRRLIGADRIRIVKLRRGR